MKGTIIGTVLAKCIQHDLRPIAVKGVGSRMIGVPHDDSDYDVQFLFSHDGHRYASIGGYVGNIDTKNKSYDIDLHGWNVDKFASMVSETNPSAWGFLNSDIEYGPDMSGFLDEIEAAMYGSGNRMALYHHYRSLAKNNYRQYIENGNDPTKGRGFYTLRAIMYSRYIRETDRLPHVNVRDFLNELPMADEATVDKWVDALVYLAGEKEEGRGGEALDVQLKEIVEDEFAREPSPHRLTTNSVSTKLLDSFVKECVP